MFAFTTPLHLFHHRLLHDPYPASTGCRGSGKPPRPSRLFFVSLRAPLARRPEHSNQLGGTEMREYVAAARPAR